MKKTDIAILCACAFAVWATDGRADDAFAFEVGTGYSNGQPWQDGVWYQKDRPHRLELDTVPASIGVSYKPGNVRYRIEYVKLGTVYSKAQVSRDIEYYPGTTIPASRVVVGRGDTDVLALTASKPIIGPLYAEAGVLAYRSKGGQFDVYDLETGEHLRNRKVPDDVFYGPTVGFGVRYGAVDVGIRYYGMQQRSEERPPLLKEAYVMQFRFVF